CLYNFWTIMRYLFLLIFLTTNAFSQNYHYAVDKTSEKAAPDTTAPSSPTNLVADNITQNSATLNWTAATDNVGVVIYRVYNNNDFLQSTGGPVTTFTLTGLTPATNYSLTIRAVDAASNTSQDSNTLIVTTATIPNGNSYTLTESASTSAGIYDKNDNLIRTLWSNVTQNPGTYNAPSWDGLNDDGENALEQADHIKVIANNIKATWDGVIGNTSDNFIGKNIHKEYIFYHDMLISGGYAYLS